MSAKMQTKVQASPGQNFMPALTGLLQRQCALCNTPGLVEDSKRDKEKPTLQHSSADQAGITTVPRFGHDFNRVSVHSTGLGMIQTKLKINEPGDIYEQEADRVADAVMRMPEPKVVSRQTGNPSECPDCEPEELRKQPEEEEEELIQPKPLADQITPIVQRQVEGKEEETIQTKPLADQITLLVQRQPDPVEEEEDEKKTIQAKEISGRNADTTSDLESSINAIKSGGRHLAESERTYFEPRFGFDFSHVRVHTESSAADIAKSINARAFTLGNHVAMGSGEYHPNSRSGQRLLGHELTHVIQQGEGWTSSKAQHRESIESDPIDAAKQDPDDVSEPNNSAVREQPEVMLKARGVVQRSGRRRRRLRPTVKPPTVVEVTTAVYQAEAMLALPDHNIWSKIAKQRMLDEHYHILHSLRWRAYATGRSRDEQLLFQMRKRVNRAAKRLYWQVRNTKEYKAMLASERAAKIRAQRMHLKQLATRYSVPLLTKTVAADLLMAEAERIKLPSPTSSTGRVLGKMSHRRALVKLIMANTPNPAVKPAELTTHQRIALGNYIRTHAAFITISAVRSLLTVAVGKLIAEHRALYRLMRKTTAKSLSHIPKADRALIRPAASRRVKALLVAWKRTLRQLSRANRQWNTAKAAVASARKALNPNSKEARQAILERQLRKRSVAHLEARAAKALLAGKFAAWAVAVIVKYAGIPYGDASKWGQHWRRKSVPVTLATLVTTIRLATKTNRKLGQRLINIMLKRYPRVVQLTCDQVSELLLRERGFRLKGRDLGLTGQAQWFLKRAAAARAGTVSHFKPFVSIRDAPVGSVLFFPSWSSKAGRWQIAASHPGFKPVMDGFTVSTASSFPLMGKPRPTPIVNGDFEYWHIRPGTLSRLDPSKGGALLKSRYRHYKSLGFWVRFPTGNYKAPQVLRWTHVSTVIKVQGNKVISFESGWKPRHAHAHITPGKSVSFLKMKNTHVGYVSGP